MLPQGDDRAQAVQVGVVILFGFLVVALALYQSTVVPQENAEIEFQHSQEAHAGFEDARNAILRTAATGASQPVSFSLGTRYPPRTFFVNPPPASGSFGTEATGNASVAVSIAGAESTGEIGEFWNGSTHRFNTGFLVYEPRYNEYREAPTTRYEHSVVLNEFSNGERLRLTGQTAIDGRRISLVLLNGSISANGVAQYTVEPRPLSVSENTVTFRNETAAPTITFPTTLPNETWQSLVAGNRYVSVSVTEANPYDEAVLRLKQGTTYTLNLARIGVGTVPDPDEEAVYLTSVDPLSDSLVNGTEDDVVVEARDRYNNPVSDVDITVSSTGGLNVSSESGGVTNGDGHAVFTVTPDGATNDASVNFSIDGGDQPYEVVSYSGRRVAESGGVGGDINPAANGDVVFVSEAVPRDDRVELVLDNGADEPVNLTRARINFYLETENNKNYASADLSVPGGPSRATLAIAGQYETVTPPIELAPGENTIRLDFDGDAKISKGEFFVASFVYSTGEADTYFVSLKDPGTTGGTGGDSGSA